MRKTFRLLFSLFLVLSGYHLYATHITGGAISYECLGNNQYKIALTIYRDCGPGTAPFDNAANLAIYNSSNGLVKNLSLPFPGSIQIPGTINSSCFTAPNNVCVEEAIYTTIETLPPIAGGYTLVHQRCCRNGTVLNINNPGDVGASFTTHIPGPEKVSCNSSPVFKSLPPIYLCAGLQFNFDHSATDKDGDQLVYELCDPFIGATPTSPSPNPSGPPPYGIVSWKPPYNSVAPISSNPQISIDPQTGLLSIKPDMIGQWVLGVCVKEIRNGVVLSVIKREFQFNVISCPNLILADFNLPASNCTGLTFNFTNTSFNTTSYLWNFGDGGSTSTAKDPTYTFSAPGTYVVTLIANPGAGCSDTIKKTMVVNPLLNPDFTVPNPNCFLSHSYDFSVTGVFSSSALFQWTFPGGNPSSSSLQNVNGVKFFQGGTFNVQLLVFENGCVRNIQKSVLVYPEPVSDFVPPVNNCQNFSFAFTNGSSNASTYLWDFGDMGGTSTQKDPNFTFSGPGNYQVTLISNPGSQCPDTVTKTVTVHPILAPNITLPTEACFNGHSYDFSVAGQYTNSAVFAWNFPGANPSTSSQNNVSGVQFPQAGTFPIQLNVFENGCTRSINQNVVVHPDVKAEIEPQLAFCKGFTYQFRNKSQHATSYFWNFGDPLNPTASSTAIEPAYTFSDTGIHTITLIAYGPACTDTVRQNFRIYPLLDAKIGLNDKIQCFDDHLYHFKAMGSYQNYASFEWNLGGVANIPFSTKNIVDSVSFNSHGHHQVVLTIKENGCTSTTTTGIELQLKPVAIFNPITRNGCTPLKVEFVDLSTSASPLEHFWQFGDGGTSKEGSPVRIYTEPGTYDVSLRVKSTAGCIADTTHKMLQAVTVYPLPEAGFEARPDLTTILDPVIEFLDLSSGGAWNVYHFSDGGIEEGIDVAHTFADTGIFRVRQTAYSKFNCIDTISLTVKVIPEYNFYIPNAFTPNEDGLNDVFLPVQTGIRDFEMAIFNRWGQQVFYTNNKKFGWDGTINGKPAPNEVYTYRIVLVNDFGQDYSFMGQVTLLR